MGSKKKPKMEVAEYRLSIHMGVAANVDRILALYCDGKRFWSGSINENTTISISKKSLFGGIKEEGGLYGHVHVLMGDGGQVLSSWLANKLKGQPGVPGFRGFLSLFFTGRPGDRKGFMWSANSPYIKPVWVKCEHVPGGLHTGYASFSDGSVNPAHVIYEIMTLPELGIGALPEEFDLTAWNAAAQTLYNENLGVAFAWVNQSTGEQIINDLQQVINGWVFQHPRTGLWTLKLVRDDYDPNDLPTVTPDNAILSNFQRKAFGETVNEIVVTWTNPDTEQEETVTVHDNGNIAAQGALVSDSRNYYSIRSAAKAVELAQRDLRIASTPLCACDAILNRQFWDIVPGDVVKLTWPEYGLNNLVMRVGKVDYGMPGDHAIKVNLVEDVFSEPIGTYVTPPSSGWTDPSEDPAPIPSNLTHIVTVPTYFLSQLFEDEGLPESPEVYAGLLVTQSGNDTFEYDLLSYLPDSSGTSAWRHIDNKPTVGYGVLAETLSRADTSNVVELDPMYGSSFPAVGCFVWIGNPSNFSEANNAIALERAELCLITGYNAVTGWALRRGVLDTQPLEWAAGTPFWIIDPDTSIVDDGNARSVGSSAQYKALPITSRGALEESSALTFSMSLTDRPYRPARPANVRIGGVLWGEGLTIPIDGGATFSWSNRNRLTETAQVLAWTAANVAPEAGQETVIELFDGEAKVDSSYKVRRTVTGTSTAFTYNELLEASVSGNIGWSVYSVRSGQSSFSRVSGSLEVEIPPIPLFGGVGEQVHVTSGDLEIVLPDLGDTDPDDCAIFVTIMYRGDITPPAGWTLVGDQLLPEGGSPAVSTQVVAVYRKDAVTSGDSESTTIWSQSGATAGTAVGQAIFVKTSESGKQIVVAEVASVADSSSPYNVPVVTGNGYPNLTIEVASFINALSNGNTTIGAPSGTTQHSPSSVPRNRLGLATRHLVDGQETSGQFTTSSTGSNQRAGIIVVRLELED